MGDRRLRKESAKERSLKAGLRSAPHLRCGRALAAPWLMQAGEVTLASSC